MKNLADTNFPAYALLRLLDHVEHAERSHYDECSPIQRRKHIYNSVRQIRDWANLALPARSRTARWKAEITYNDGSAPDEHVFEELEELHDLIECGPNFYTIDRIAITLNVHSMIAA